MACLPRRSLLIGLALAPAIIPSRAFAAPQRVAAPVAMPPGSIVVFNRRCQLFLALDDGSALRYRVAVGRTGMQWVGTVIVNGKHVRPAWSPPADIRRDNPRLPDVIPSGSPLNPMGERVLTLAPGEYAIHGTNRPDTIGRHVSYGCVRMHNDDVIDLYDRVPIGAPVTMLP